MGLGFRVTAPVLDLRNGVSRSVTVSLFVPESSHSGFRVSKGAVLIVVEGPFFSLKGSLDSPFRGANLGLLEGIEKSSAKAWGFCSGFQAYKRTWA